MATVTIDGKSIEFQKGETIIRAATREGIEIPYYCWHPRLSVAANCRMCLVDVEKQPKLAPACQTECGDGMIVHTTNQKVKDAQRAVHEFLLINHPIDCPICDQAGECKLQNYYMEYQKAPSRMLDEKVNKPRLERLGPNVVYNAERCIMCTRCVRFMDEVAKDRQLGVFNRGDHAEIGIFPGQELDSPYSMNTVDVCPVGALTAVPFRFKQRAWNLQRTDGVCGGCAKGCNIHVEQRGGNVYRFLPRENDAVNQSWLCDTGRLTYNEANEDRLKYAMVRGAGDGQGASNWSVPKRDALAKAVELLKPVADAGKGLSVALSLYASVEETYLIGRLAKEVLRAESVAIIERGPRADWKADDILRVADRNPNRAGVTAVLRGLGLTVLSQEELEKRLGNGGIKALVLFGHETDRHAELAAACKKLEVFVHVAHRRTALVDAAQVILPAVASVEVEGTWVNSMGLAQRLSRAFDPFEDAQPHDAWAQELAAGLGLRFALPSVQTVRAEMERVFSLAPGSLTDVPPSGRDVKAWVS